MSSVTIGDLLVDPASKARIGEVNKRVRRLEVEAFLQDFAVSRSLTESI